MDILLLGNGFDLSYSLPTQYINFLHTVDFLVNHYSESMQTSGDVFSDRRLQEADGFIVKCYEEHKRVYDNAPLQRENILSLIEKAKENLWFSYLLKSVHKNIKWIDLEREIGTVILGIQKSFEVTKRIFTLSSLGALSSHVLETFGFYLVRLNGPSVQFKADYIVENPAGSRNYALDTARIAEELSLSLYELVEMLRLYLLEFVDRPVSLFDKEDYESAWFAELQPDYVVTFNYTRTYEMFQPNTKVLHIHGEIEDKIVLGINPDDSDEITSIDTTFLPFKKYFQRVVWKTDAAYLGLVAHLKEVEEDISLCVMGHSLDVTDEDIIKELFGSASKITVLYRNQNSLATYVSKLIEIYGKKEFDYLRYNRGLKFVSIEDELPAFVNAVKEKKEEKAFLEGFL